MEFNGPIYKRVDKKHGWEYAEAGCTSSQIIQDLNNKFNVTEFCKKNHCSIPPLLDYPYNLSFINGLIDADGFVCQRKKTGRWRLGLCGDFEVLRWVAEIFSRYIYYKVKVHKLKREVSLFALEISGNRAILIAKQMFLLRELDNIRLSRKWGDLFQILI